jgi:hypothetical protein
MARYNIPISPYIREVAITSRSPSQHKPPFTNCEIVQRVLGEMLADWLGDRLLCRVAAPWLALTRYSYTIRCSVPALGVG